MSDHHATIEWSRGDQPFLDNRYARAHDWRFDGGATVRGSSAPSALVPAPLSDPAAVDPEEALVAALSSCHMLFFLDFARRAGAVVTGYEDSAEAVMGKGEDGKVRITKVTLRPRIAFAREAPDAAVLDGLHHQAHEACFIANSVTCEVVVEGNPFN